MTHLTHKVGTLATFIRTACLYLMVCATCVADSYTYVDEDGERVTIEARSIGSGLGFEALERRDGQIQLVPPAAIVDRVPADGPVPLTRDEMAELIEERFGKELVRTRAYGNFVIALVLSSPIERRDEPRVAKFVEKASRFMKQVDDMFVRYARTRDFPLHEPRFPMVLTIFESDDQFNEYAAEATGGNGLTVSSILGFYSPITNWLAVRMSSCDSFAVPLHEAIHLQMYNRVFQRLAPVPKWFDEGIATGFEGEGERITRTPAKINTLYASRAQGRLSWDVIIENDAAFTADILAGEAYVQAWCMHWLLANHHRDEYSAYVRKLAKLPTLGEAESTSRVERFESTFGASIRELQSEFPDVLQREIRNQRVRFEPNRADGLSETSSSMGAAEIQVVSSRGQLNAAGQLRNASPFRTLSFYVTVEAAEGVYTEWLLHDVTPNRKIPLKKQVLSQRFSPGVRMPSGTYQVFIRSTESGSQEANAWKSGRLPGPYLSE